MKEVMKSLSPKALAKRDSRQSNRRVYLFANLVIKVYGDRTYKGLGREQNLTEIATFKKAQGTPAEKYLAPIVAYHPEGDWLAMKRYEATGQAPTTEQVEKIYEVATSLGLCDVWLSARQGNAVVSKDGPVIVDYGL